MFEWYEGNSNAILGGGGDNNLLEVGMDGGHPFLFFICTFLGTIVEIFQNGGLLHNVFRHVLKNYVVEGGGRRLCDGGGGMDPPIMDFF